MRPETTLWWCASFLALLCAEPGLRANGACPSACVCKWRGGKQTVECIGRALISIPGGIDEDTQVLDVSGNNLQTIPKETFYKMQLSNLQKVYLRSCRIGEIGVRAFRGLTNLIELDLSENLLTFVPSATFEDTPFLKYLALAGNPIQKIEANAFKGVMGLNKIDLSHCQIQSVSPAAFDKLESLEWLKLNGNRLTGIHPRTVGDIGKLQGVDLHDNPWVCDCKLRAAKEWLSQSDAARAVPPRCAAPERLSGRFFTDLSVEDFACKPLILPSSRYVEVAAGENATVSCRVGAVPPANVHWYWNGRLLLNNSAFSAFQKIFIREEGEFERKSLLILTNALDTDSGEFNCVAENRAGSAEANFTLDVSWGRERISFRLGKDQIVGIAATSSIIILVMICVIFLLLLRADRLPLFARKIATRMRGSSRTRESHRSESRTRNISRVSPGNGENSSATAGKDPQERTRESVGLHIFQPRSVLDPAPFAETAAEPHRNQGTRPASTANEPDSWRPSSHLRERTSARETAPSDELEIIEEDGSNWNRGFKGDEYPSDYGLPIPNAQETGHELLYFCGPSRRPGTASDPVSALSFERPYPHLRMSPDEGYQEGFGTDV